MSTPLLPDALGNLQRLLAQTQEADLVCIRQGLRARNIVPF